MKNEWRTPEVVQLCLSLQQTSCSGSTALLIEALQRAGCNDKFLLSSLAAPNLDTVEIQALVAMVKSEEGAQAVKRIEEIAATLGPNYGYDEYDDLPMIKDEMGYKELMEAAAYWLRTGDYTTQMGSERWRDTFPMLAKEFWECYQTVTGFSHTRQHGSFFSCSC